MTYTDIQSFVVHYLLLFETGKHGMVKFYQSWCGHCMRMKPDWDRLAEEENNDSILIADVNCGDQKEVSKLVGPINALVGYHINIISR